MKLHHIGLFIALLIATPSLNAASVSTNDGLTLSLDGATGAIIALSIDGNPIPLLGAASPLTIQLGSAGPTIPIMDNNFASQDATWVSADGANWDNAGDYVHWLPDGGVDNSAHLLLGNGSRNGVGMALASPISVEAKTQLTISYQAMSASTETLQIIGVRVFDADGTDITSSANRPTGWTYSTVSMGHVIPGIGNSSPNTWEPFSFSYGVPEGAVSALVSIRHWNSGDHLVHIDDLNLVRWGGIAWSEPEPLVATPSPQGDGFVLSGSVAEGSLDVSAAVQPSGEAIAMRLALQSVPASLEDRAVRLQWNLPADLEGWTWWNDIASSEVLAGDTVVKYVFPLAQHDISWYPLATVSSGEIALSLSVPMREPVVQHFEASATGGLSSVWELGLSPLTTKIGPGHAEVSLLLSRCDGDWGFRSALERFQTRFADDFLKLTTREGAWEYPIPVSAISSPEDFGFAHFEHWELNWNLQPDELEALHDANVASHFYVEPFMIWDSWPDTPSRPTSEMLMARAQLWAENPGSHVTWIHDGGIGDSGHIMVGDIAANGTGMATAQRYPVTPGQTLTISWQARTANIDTAQILGVRIFDADGIDITQSSAAPSGWFFSTASMGHVVVTGLTNTLIDTWEPFERTYVVPAGAAEARFSLRHWTGGDHAAHIDNFTVVASGEVTPLLFWDFNTNSEEWSMAVTTNWDATGGLWSLVPRQEMAQAVLQSSPHTVSGDLAVIELPSLWRPNDAGTGGSQLWPLNLDPELPEPNAHSTRLEYYVNPSLASDDGIYVDSVTIVWGFGDWQNHRPDHLPFVDFPLTFDTRDGRAIQIGFQSHIEFFQSMTPYLRAQHHLVMSNLFPEGHRYIAPWSDLMGSEVGEFTEAQERSRLRRSLAGTRIVSNLLQRYHLDEYATHEEMAEYMRSNLFWGFHPAVSSIGKSINGRPDRYFLHPELYERDRDLFQTFMPVIKTLGEAGWQPIPHARGAGLDVERFGEANQNAICFTIRAANGEALTSALGIDLLGLGVDSLPPGGNVHNLFTDEAIPFTTSPDGHTLTIDVTLDAGEVLPIRVSDFIPLPTQLVMMSSAL